MFETAKDLMKTSGPLPTFPILLSRRRAGLKDILLFDTTYLYYLLILSVLEKGTSKLI